MRQINMVVIACVILAALSGCGSSTSPQAEAAPRSPSLPVGPIPIATYTSVGEKAGTALQHNPFTIRAIVTLTQASIGHQRIFEQGGYGNLGGVGIETNGTDDGVACLLWNSTGFDGVEAALALNTKTEVTCSYDGGTVRLYIDGVLADSKSAVTYLAPNTNIFIGQAASVSAGNRDFQGTIEAVDLYDEALSTAQIFALGE